MKHLLLTTIAAVVLVGCSESQSITKAPDISIQNAATIGHIDAVKQHLAAGADVNAKAGISEKTPLHEAASSGHKEVVELLIANGADVNQVAKMKRVDVSGNTTVKTTPLDFAKRHPETADLLRKHGGKTAEELKAEGR